MSSMMALKPKLSLDDFIEIKLSVLLQRYDRSEKNQDTEEQNINCVIFQFHSQANSEMMTFENKPTIEIQGLVFFILSHTNSNEKWKRSYYMTYRYFSTLTVIKKEYLNILVENTGALKRRRKN